jgi:uncharacterized glyoxalase superfamily protein PhnB
MTSALPSVYPVVRYRDAPAAIEFLTRAFQLGRSEVHEGPDGTVLHAQLTWGTGMVMLGSNSEGGDGLFDTGKAVVYLAVDDPDKHHDHAVAEGAEIVMELVDQPYGSRDYAALDPEGNVWSFGTYRPGPDAP